MVAQPDRGILATNRLRKMSPTEIQCIQDNIEQDCRNTKDIRLCYAPDGIPTIQMPIVRSSRILRIPWKRRARRSFGKDE